MTAGFTGRELSRLLQGRTFHKDFIECGGRTRINVKLKAARESEINGTGLEVGAEHIRLLLNKAGSLQESDVLILSGSIPEGIDRSFYRSMLEQTPEGVLTVVDATGQLLRDTLSCRPFLIKPNQAELEEFFNEPLTTGQEIAQAGRKMQGLGAQNVLISRGKDGALLVGMDGSLFSCKCPQGKLVNSVGSGDSMVAGFVAGWLQTHSLEQALIQSIYCGSATAFCADLAQKADIERLMDTSPVQVQRLELKQESR